MSNWKLVCPLDHIPRLGARVVRRPAGGDIALFRNADDEVFALHDKCAHKGGPLSDGIVHGSSVTCPLHNWVFDLATGTAQGADEGRVRTYPVKVEDGLVSIAPDILLQLAAE